MKFYNNTIHTKSQLIKSILGCIEFPLFIINGYINKQDLIVLNYHSTPYKFMEDFERQIQFYKKYFLIISPNELKDYYYKNLDSKKPKLLITFDDGLSNNIFALQVLNKYNIKALLFIVPDFINAIDQKKYYTTYIRNQINTFVDSNEEDFKALSWIELQELIDLGHQVGSHSMSHTLKANTNIMEDLDKEISGSKNNIEANLNIKIDNFCAPFNTLQSVGKNEINEIVKNYDFFHSTFPGSNFQPKNKHFIKRCNVECFWSIFNIIHTLGYIERWRWRKQRIIFDDLIKESQKTSLK